MTFTEELRYKLITQIREKAEYRKKVLKIEKFYFNDLIDGVSCYDKLPINSFGNIVSFANMKGSTLRKMLKSIDSGDIYGFVEYKGSRCKIKPKKFDTK